MKCGKFRSGTNSLPAKLRVSMPFLQLSYFSITDGQGNKSDHTKGTVDQPPVNGNLPQAAGNERQGKYHQAGDDPERQTRRERVDRERGGVDGREQRAGDDRGRSDVQAVAQCSVEHAAKEDLLHDWGADRQRENDLDGCGNLSARGLEHFCQFFLTCCPDGLLSLSL